MKIKKKIGFISLGCDKNRVDLERIMSLMQENGYEISNNPEDCNIVIINTCSFIKSARDETEETIIEFSNLKNENRIEKLIVTGCYNELGKKDLEAEFPQVDAFVRVKDNCYLPQIVNNLYSKNVKKIINTKSRVLTTPQFAYLKISDGCDNFCSYCKIPYIRGRYKSEPLDELILEAKNLADNGITELILVAQDLIKYGSDFKDGTTLITLIRELSKIDKIKWIRLLYCYPESITNELIDEIKTNNKVCKYMDIPLQHISNPILKLMNRRTTEETTIKLIKKLKQEIPQIAIRTTFIVGFPNEQKEDYEKIKSFLKQNKLNNVGFFAYSREEGTRAYNFDNQLTEEEKEKRVSELGEIQYKITLSNNKKMLNKILNVVVDEITDGYAICRSEFLAPFIDGVIIADANNNIKVGNYYKLKIVDYSDYDLKGEFIYE